MNHFENHRIAQRETRICPIASCIDRAAGRARHQFSEGPAPLRSVVRRKGYPVLRCSLHTCPVRSRWIAAPVKLSWILVSLPGIYPTFFGGHSMTANSH